MQYCGEKEPPFTLVWKIKNFSFCEKREESYIESPSFTIPSTTYKFILRFYPRLGGCCSCQLIRCRQGKNCVLTIRHMFELNCIIGDTLTSKIQTYKLQRGEASWWSFSPDHLDTTEKNENRFLPGDTLTVALHMWGKFLRDKAINQIIARTKIEVEKCTLDWVIKNFSSFSSEKIVISFPSKTIYKISLIVLNDDTIRITSHNLKSDIYTHVLKCQLYVFDSTGYKKEVKLQKCVDDCIDENWVFPPTLTKDKLRKEKLTLLVQDTLRLSCKFFLSTRSKVHRKLEHHFVKISNTRSNVSGTLNAVQKDIHNMYISKQNTDVQFMIEGKMLSAHKFILASRSPVFSAMFSDEYLENKNGIIDIQDIEYTILDEMLKFMYGGTLENLNYERAVELIVVADRYQFNSLKEECSLFLRSILCVNNVCKILVISDTIHDGTLKDFAVEYINFDRKKVLVSDEWKELKESNTRLANEVLTVIALNM